MRAASCIRPVAEASSGRRPCARERPSAGLHKNTRPPAESSCNLKMDSASVLEYLLEGRQISLVRNSALSEVKAENEQRTETSAESGKVRALDFNDVVVVAAKKHHLFKRF